MTRIPRVPTALLCLLLLGACAGRTPGSAVTSFYRAVERGDTDEALEFVDQQVVATLGRDKLRLGLLEQAKEIQSKGGISDIEITNEQVSGETATVASVVKYGDGTQEMENHQLVRQEGKWRIRPSK